MQSAETVLGVLCERGRRGLPLNELYRQMFNPQLYLLAYGRIYANQGAMTAGVTPETVDGMSVAKIGRIIEAIRFERYRVSCVIAGGVACRAMNCIDSCSTRSCICWPMDVCTPTREL